MKVSQLTIDIKMIPRKKAPIVDVKMILNGVIVYAKQASMAFVEKGDKELSIEGAISLLINQIAQAEKLTGYLPKEQNSGQE